MIALVGAYVAKESREALAQVNGVSIGHQNWGTRTFYLALALTVISAVWLWPNMQQRTIAGLPLVEMFTT